MCEANSCLNPNRISNESSLNHEAIPEQISWFPNALQRAALGISKPQLDRDKAVLRELEIGKVGRFGCDRETFKILVHFRKLVRERGRESAILELYETYKEQSNG